VAGGVNLTRVGHRGIIVAARTFAAIRADTGILGSESLDKP
jgi:hypothetical protein